MGNITGADAQFIEGLYHIDLHHNINDDTNDSDAVLDTNKEESSSLSSESDIPTNGFGVWKETKDGGNTNFITGAGGWLQNIIYGYAGLRYEQDGTLSINQLTLLPGGITSVKLKGINLGKSRFNMLYNSSSVMFEASSSFIDYKSSDNLQVADASGNIYSFPVMFNSIEEHVPFVVSLLESPSSCF